MGEFRTPSGSQGLQRDLIDQHMVSSGGLDASFGYLHDLSVDNLGDAIRESSLPSAKQGTKSSPLGASEFLGGVAWSAPILVHRILHWRDVSLNR